MTTRIDTDTIDFALDIFSGSLDTETVCEISGATHIRYADEMWSGWLPLGDLQRASSAQSTIEEAARKAANGDVEDGDEDDRQWRNAYRRWVWQLLHDRISGVEDASDEWRAVLGDRDADDVAADAARDGKDVETWIAEAAEQARRQGAGLRPDVVATLVDEVTDAVSVDDGE